MWAHGKYQNTDGPSDRLVMMCAFLIVCLVIKQETLAVSAEIVLWLSFLKTRGPGKEELVAAGSSGSYLPA